MAQSSPSEAVGMAMPSQVQTSPPIFTLLPLVASALSAGSTALSYFVWILKTVLLSLFSPFLVVVPIAIYLFSPLIISSKILLDLFVVLPFRAASYTSQAVYPIYAFFGVACLYGAVVGFGGRQIVSWVGWGLLGEIQSTQRSGSPTHRDAAARTQKRPSASARGKRKVTVKIED